MPPLTIPMPILADTMLMVRQLKVPHDWKQPRSSPEKDHFRDAFTPAEHTQGATAALPPNVFGPATTNKYHGDASKMVSDTYRDFMKEAANKIKQAMDTWRPKVRIKSVNVLALTGLGQGVLDAPNIKNEPAFATWTHKESNGRAYIKAVVEGFSKNFMDFVNNVTMPGLPLWPAFVAFPGPQAPPMPGLPMPLITYISPRMSAVTVPMELKNAFLSELDGGVKRNDASKYHEDMFESLAIAVTTAILAWLPMQMVTNVLAKGPIPTFAPPFVPVGPVMVGDVLPTGGHLL